MLPEKTKYILALALGLSFLIFSIQLYVSLPVRQVVVSSKVDEGKLLWQKHNCVSCHQIYGLGGFLGPDLTNCYSNRDSLYLKAILKTGNNIMPNLQLTDQDIAALLVYLKHIDQSGRSDPRTFSIQNNGTIEQ